MWPSFDSLGSAGEEGDLVVVLQKHLGDVAIHVVESIAAHQFPLTLEHLQGRVAYHQARLLPDLPAKESAGSLITLDLKGSSRSQCHIGTFKVNSRPSYRGYRWEMCR